MYAMKKPAVPSVVVVVILLAIAVITKAQQPKKLNRVGYLKLRSGPEDNGLAFQQRLRELGYIEGQTIVIEWRFAGKSVRYPLLAAELVQIGVEAIVTNAGDEPILAAMKATKTIPIIFETGSDPIARGFVASLAHPEGNLTGVSWMAHELGGKRLELLKEAVPNLIRIAILGDPEQRNYPVQMTDLKAAAQSLHLELHPVRIQKADDVEGAFSAITNAKDQAFFLIVNPALGGFRNKIIELAGKNRLPGIYSNQDWVNAGGLMTYAPDRIAIAQRLAVYVDRILKGARPADLPVERPTKFELVINLQTAKQIGLTIPPNVLARADRVIR
jgi:putative tryptophan/tyrosine transport system substrate-binding protein